jgi:hypothetical protein
VKEVTHDFSSAEKQESSAGFAAFDSNMHASNSSPGHDSANVYGHKDAMPMRKLRAKIKSRQNNTSAN